MSKERITIAVSGLNNIDSPGPGVPVIRGLLDASSFDARIVGLAYENLEPGIYMEDLIHHVYQVPYPSFGMDNLLDRLLYIHKREQIQVLIPNFDSELLPLIKLVDVLESKGIRTFLPTLEQYQERMKDLLPDYGRKYKILVPESLPASSAAEIPHICRELKGPYMVKGKFYDAYLAHNQEEVVALFYKISAKWGLPVVIQQHIQGTEVNVVALGDGKGETIGAVPMKKQYITDKGKAWGGITISDPKMLRLTHHIMEATSWRGGMELELIRTREGEYYLIEINPRIPAWVYLAVGAGQNLPEALVNLAMGREVKPMVDFEVGKMFVRYSYDLIINSEEYQSFAIKGEKINDE